MVVCNFDGDNSKNSFNYGFLVCNYLEMNDFFVVIMEI